MFIFGAGTWGNRTHATGSLVFQLFVCCKAIMFRALRLFFCLVVFSVSAIVVKGATVSTDQSDYAPGQTVQITGSGFSSGETVQLQVVNLSDPSDNGPEHDPWTVTADAAGNITTSWYVTPDEGGATLQLTAHGLTSGQTAQTTFTDSSHVVSVTVGSASTNTTYGTGQAVTYVVTILANGNGAGTSTPTISGLPAGVTGVFNPASVDLNAVNNNPGNTTNITLTVTTVTNTGVVTNTFTVTAQTSPLISTNGTLIVKPKPLTANGTLSVASSKVYDGTTNPSLSGSAALQSAEAFGAGSATDGKPYSGDAVSLTGTAAYAYNSKDVSTATNVAGTGLSLTGAKSSNYTLVPLNFAATITALPVVLTGTRAYDGTTAAAFGILSVSNKIGSDTISVGSGSGTLASASAGVRAITSFGTLALSNNATGDYTLTGASGAVTITQIISSLSLASSKNPDGFNDTVSFTAGVTSGATGNVIFLTNGAALSTNALSGTNAASPAISTLPRGTNVITAIYGGDANFTAATNTLNQVVTNHPPVANPMVITRTAGLGCKFSLAELGTNWSDVDGDTVALAQLTMTTSNGVTLVTNGNFIIYSNNPSASDIISYKISDGHGGTNSGVVNINVNAFVTGQQTAQMTFTSNSASIKFQGIPGYTYTTQRNTNLAAGLGWISVSTNSAASSNGLFNVTDNFNDLGHVAPASAYYRLLWHP